MNSKLLTFLIAAFVLIFMDYRGAALAQKDIAIGERATISKNGFGCDDESFTWGIGMEDNIARATSRLEAGKKAGKCIDLPPGYTVHKGRLSETYPRLIQIQPLGSEKKYWTAVGLLATPEKRREPEDARKSGGPIKKKTEVWITQDQGCFAMIAPSYQALISYATSFYESENPKRSKASQEAHRAHLLAMLERNPDGYKMVKPNMEVIVREKKKGPYGDVVRVWNDTWREKKEQVWVDAKCLRRK